jgi:parallel beta-helix repeat protein
MGRKKETGRILGVVLVTLCIGLLASRGFASVSIPSDPDAGTWDGSTYTLTGDVDEPIVVTQNDLTLDGNGYTVTGNGEGWGITVGGRTNVVLTRLNVTNFAIGICLNDSDYTMVINNTTFNNTTKGIEVGNSSLYSVVCMNTILGNPTGMYFGNYTRWNSIYNNSFINNITQVSSGFTNDNTYYEPSPIGGNYWSDHTGEDIEPDGFIDTPRINLPGSAEGDQLPLVNLYLIKFFDDSIELGTIAPTTDNPKPAAKRITQFRDLLVSAQALIETGDYTSACEKLDKALAACDGIEPPPDKIMGVEGEDDFETLIGMIESLKIALGC